MQVTPAMRLLALLRAKASVLPKVHRRGQLAVHTRRPHLEHNVFLLVMQQTKRRVAWLFGLACASQGRVHDAHAALSELVSQAADGGVELGPRMWTWGTRRKPTSLPSPSDALQVSRTLARLLVQHSKYALVLPVCDRVLSHCPDDVPLLVHKVRLVKYSLTSLHWLPRW